MLDWANQFSILLFLDSNSYQSPHGKYECLLAAGEVGEVSESLEQLQQAHDAQPDWYFGHLCYDYKNQLEPRLHSRHAGKQGFPELYFFRPRYVCYISSNHTTLTIEALDADPASVYYELLQAHRKQQPLPSITFQQRTARNEYLTVIDKLRRHIADGDCYEINYCTEGYSNGVTLSPPDAFARLNELSPAPFAAYYRLQDTCLMCSSPERYLQKSGGTLIAQPIKGTAKRGENEAADEQAKQALHSSIKERAENVMIVDLTRNDLARVCETGSVSVEELFGIYTFPKVHQMISTVSGKMRAGVPFTDAIRYSFPMGSMTGAPKMKVMELTDTYEQARRELFSGTVGYISPMGDFDFNVVIRSLFYNAATQYLSYQTGGAITYDSDALQEWEEMRLKAWALERIFS